MAESSLAGIIDSMRAQLMGPQSGIPAASPEFLASAQNPNIRNFGPGQQPEFENPILAMLSGGAGQNAGQGIGDSLAIRAMQGKAQPQIPGGAQGVTPPQGNQGFLAQIMRSLGLGNVADPLLGRQQKIEDILNQAN